MRRPRPVKRLAACGCLKDISRNAPCKPLRRLVAARQAVKRLTSQIWDRFTELPNLWMSFENSGRWRS